MKTMHLFAGIGGGLLADLILGHEPVVAVEWDKYACNVLRARVNDGWFPGLDVWEGDVRDFDATDYTGRVDCIHAGFPCQDISYAGKQAGIGEGTRSGLYREAVRIACDIRPRYIFLENVAAIATNGLDRVIADLSEIGYDARWTTLSAADVGAWHRRDRWWCLAANNGSKRVQGEQPQTVQGEQPLPWCKNVGGVEDLRNRPDIPSPLIWGVRNGFPRYVDRIKALGNAQVPLQAAVAFSILIDLFEDAA